MMKMRGFGLFLLLLIGALSAFRVSGDVASTAQTIKKQSELVTTVDAFNGEGILVTPIKVVSNRVQLPECSKQHHYANRSIQLVSTLNVSNRYHYALSFCKNSFPAYIVFRSLLI